ncbi:MAG: hypothetical protein HFF38_11015 [Lawsonibacter sp.]|nr:hypothetical protein [Lawsonibacter sp.]
MPQTRQHMQRRTTPQRLRQGHEIDTGVHMTPEGMTQFLELCQAEGRVEGTLQWYRRGLKRLYEALPEDKTIRYGTLECWRETLVEKGYAPGTINSFLSISNAYLDFLGHREYQLASQLKAENEVQPELTRSEYLRLLQTARSLGRERVYLLVKLFGSTGLSVQELPNVTLEAVEDGKVTITSKRTKQVLRFSEGLRRELLEYAKRNGYLYGPIFLTREGTPMSRTYVTLSIRQLCRAAQVPEEKGNPRCLKRLYQVTRSGIEENIALLAEQAHDRLLEQEQLEIGWEGGA